MISTFIASSSESHREGRQAVLKNHRQTIAFAGNHR